MNFIKKHYKGELPLYISFLLNFLLINVICGTLIIKSNEYFEQSFKGICIFFLLALSYLFLVYPWTFIGVFKSSKKAIIEKNKKSFAIIIQLVVILHICFYVFLLRHSFDYYAALFKSNFVNNHSFVVDNKKNIIKFNGYINFGITSEFINHLKQNPDIKGLLINSRGGYTAVAERLSKIIRENKLETYSTEKCLSACTIVFASGIQRYKTKNSAIGFHKPSKGFEEYEAQTILLFKEQEINIKLLKNIYIADFEEMYYPTNSLLLEANYIHGYVEEDQINPHNIKIPSELIEKFLSESKIFTIIKKYDEPLSRKIKNSTRKYFNRGLSPIQIQEKFFLELAPIIDNSFMNLRPSTLRMFIDRILESLEKLKSSDPSLCIKLIHRQDFGPIFYSNYFSEDEINKFIELYEYILFDKYNNPVFVINKSHAEELIVKLLIENADSISAGFDLDLDSTIEYEKICDSYIKFMELFNGLDDYSLENALKHAFKEGSLEKLN